MYHRIVLEKLNKGAGMSKVLSQEEKPKYLKDFEERVKKATELLNVKKLPINICCSCGASKENLDALYCAKCDMMAENGFNGRDFPAMG